MNDASQKQGIARGGRRTIPSDPVRNQRGDHEGAEGEEDAQLLAKVGHGRGRRVRRVGHDAGLVTCR